MISAAEEFTLFLADNFTYSFVAHTTWPAVDITGHVWILGWRQILLGFFTLLMFKVKRKSHEEKQYTESYHFETNKKKTCVAKTLSHHCSDAYLQL